MKILAIAAAALFSAAALNAAEINRLSAADVKVSRAEAPAPVLQVQKPACKCGHVSGEITKGNLLAQASRNALHTYAKDEAAFKEFVAFWTPILEKFGIKVTGTEYTYQLGVIRYESADGRVVRTFIGHEMNYDALSADAMKKEQQALLEALEKKGLTPVAAFMIKTEFLRPTFNVYYLTQPDANMDHEVQLRQLKKGEDIDFDLLTGAVDLVKKDSSFSMVYIGKLLGFKSKIAADEAGAAAKLAEYKKFLSELNLEFIASRTHKLDKPIEIGETTYNYLLNMYFFQ